MTRTLIDVDDRLLGRAQEILGTGSKKDTVNAALREVVRRALAEEFLRLGAQGAFRSLADPEVMAQSWR